MESYRINGINALECVLNKEQNIKVFEKYIYAAAGSDCPDAYMRYVFQVVGDHVVARNGVVKIVGDVQKSWMVAGHVAGTVELCAACCRQDAAITRLKACACRLAAWS